MKSSLSWMVIGISLLCGCDKKPEPIAQKQIVESTPVWESVEPVDRKPIIKPAPVAESLAMQNQPDTTDEQVPPVVQKVHRPSDTRPTFDINRVRELGIGKYESSRLILYTDIDPQIAKTLPPMVDQLYDVWSDYFGELPPDREGTEFQMTGYLMKEQDRFRAAGMLPEELPYFEHGRHRGLEFWMNDQEYSYYRRHLLFHEATHCFMTLMPGQPAANWYLEGMAEYFGTHQVQSDGVVAFGLMPDTSTNFVGLGRIQMLQGEVAAGRQLSFHESTRLGNADFDASRSIPYAWSWALCVFLEKHPRYHERFHELGQHLVGNVFYELMRELRLDGGTLLEAEWSQFVREIEYGYDIEANQFVPMPKREFDAEVTLKVLANRGWQSCGFSVDAGNNYRLETTGQVTLADDPKPWLSEPQGVSVRYAHGTPIGTLQALVLVLPGDYELLDLGSSFEFKPMQTGELYLRINDFPSERRDNTGAYSVRLTQNH